MIAPNCDAKISNSYIGAPCLRKAAVVFRGVGYCRQHARQLGWDGNGKNLIKPERKRDAGTRTATH